MSSAAHAAHVTSTSGGGGEDNAQQPSIFDALSQDSLMNGLHPALRICAKFTAGLQPTYPLRILVKYYEEFYALFEFLLQNHYLKHYDASFAENFYSMKRVGKRGRLTRAERLRSLLILVGMPYARRKADLYHERLVRQQEQKPPTRQGMSSWQQRLEAFFIKYYPYVNTALETAQLVLQIAYVFSKSPVHSPQLLLAGVRLFNLTPSDHARFGNSEWPKRPVGFNPFAWLLYMLRVFPRAVAAVFAKLLGVGLFFVQFLDWYNGSSHETPIWISRPTREQPPIEMQPLDASLVTKLAPSTCPLCQKKRHNDTVLAVSGYVFCYKCITAYVDRNGRCPVTAAPATRQQLVRMFNNV